MNSQAYPLTLLDFQLTFYMIALYAHVMFKSCDACVQVILYQGAITDRNSSLIVHVHIIATYMSYMYTCRHLCTTSRFKIQDNLLSCKKYT